MVKAGYDLAKVKQFGKSGSFAKLCMGKLIENNGKMTSAVLAFHSRKIVVSCNLVKTVSIVIRFTNHFFMKSIDYSLGG